jgi:hypothetical protein
LASTGAAGFPYGNGYVHRVSIPAGEEAATIRVRPLFDTIAEAAETVDIALDPSTNGSYVLAAPIGGDQPSSRVSARVLIRDVRVDVELEQPPAVKGHAWSEGDPGEGLQARTDHEITPTLQRVQKDGKLVAVYKIRYSATITIAPGAADQRGSSGHEQRHIVAMVKAFENLAATFDGKTVQEIDDEIIRLIAADANHELPDGPEPWKSYEPIGGVFPEKS